MEEAELVGGVFATRIIDAGTSVPDATISVVTDGSIRFFDPMERVVIVFHPPIPPDPPIATLEKFERSLETSNPFIEVGKWMRRPFSLTFLGAFVVIQHVYRKTHFDGRWTQISDFHDERRLEHDLQARMFSMPSVIDAEPYRRLLAGLPQLGVDDEGESESEGEGEAIVID
jgi:hypothetical protein